MAIIPYHDELLGKVDTGEITEAQVVWLTVMQYWLTFIFILLLVFVLYNFWNFIIKQGKYHNQPLLMFYILTILLIVFRVYQLIWYFKLAVFVI